jgi:hypothetical protein
MAFGDIPGNDFEQFTIRSSEKITDFCSEKPIAYLPWPPPPCPPGQTMDPDCVIAVTKKYLERLQKMLDIGCMGQTTAKAKLEQDKSACSDAVDSCVLACGFDQLTTGVSLSKLMACVYQCKQDFDTCKKAATTAYNERMAKVQEAIEENLDRIGTEYLEELIAKCCQTPIRPLDSLSTLPGGDPPFGTN